VKVSLYHSVRPQDGSEVLPEGEYDVDQVEWISRHYSADDEPLNVGLAIFVVTSGERAGPRRRIGVVREVKAEGKAP
jgi:hypothetical protein